MPPMLDELILLDCAIEFPPTEDRTRELKSPNTRRIEVGSSPARSIGASILGEYIFFIKLLTDIQIDIHKITL